MKIHLVTKANGVGLSRDIEVLKKFLGELGHDVEYMDWELDNHRRNPEADLNIYLELFDKRWLPTAHWHVGIFNIEWLDASYLEHLPKFTQLWAKSTQLKEWFERRGLASEFTGFLSRDMNDPTVLREDRAIHVVGNSTAKGTNAVLDAWSSKEAIVLPSLTVISGSPIDRSFNGRVWQQHVSNDTLKREMNAARFHICPSEVEGWGHYIAEGLSCGAIIVTTDMAPMSYHVRPNYGRLIVGGIRHRELHTRMFVSPTQITDSVAFLTQMSPDQLGYMSYLARKAFEEHQRFFKLKAAELLARLK